MKKVVPLKWRYVPSTPAPWAASHYPSDPACATIQAWVHGSRDEDQKSRAEEMLAIKPHHFVDIITAFGDGQTQFEPHPYGHAVHSVAAEILADHAVLLRIELGADMICFPCRHNVDGFCDDTIDTSFRPEAPTSKREWNLLIDRRWCQRLGLRQDDRLTAHELCLLIRDRAGDITDIYRESPPARTAERQSKLERGITRFLAASRVRLLPEPDAGAATT